MGNQQGYNELEKKLNDEIIKNKKLEEENAKLKKLNIQLSSNKDKTNELNSLRSENQKLKIDIENLKKALTNANNQLNQINQQNMQSNQNNLNEIYKLKQELILKEKEIKELKIKANDKEKKYGKDEMIVIKFLSMNQVINYHTIICTKDDIFAHIEEEVYQTFPDFKNLNNTCLANGNTILRFKTIGENNLQNGVVVQIIPQE